MQTILLQNIQWIIGGVLGLIVWGIRLEGLVKANRQRADLQAQNFADQMEAELSTRDARIDSIEKVTDHLTKMGEDIKGTLQPLGNTVAGLDAKMDIVLKRLPQ